MALRLTKIVAIGLLLAVSALMPPGTGTAGRPAPAADQVYIIKKDGLYGFIDRTGKLLVEPRFGFARDFSEGLAVVLPAGAELYGYIDKTGNFVIPPQFKQAYDFSEGLAAVDSGYIDKTGRLVINRPGYPFHNGKARLFGKPAVIIDNTGAVILTAPYDEVTETKGGLVAFVENGKMGFMTWDNRVAIKPRYQYPRYRPEDLFRESIAPVSINLSNKSSWGFIDKTGRTVIDFRYDWAEQFREGMALVGKDHAYGYVDAAGRLAIPLQFEEAWNFSEGLAAVKVGGLWGFIDKQGKMVIKPEYLSLRWGSPMEFHEGLAAVRTPGGTGFINKAGEMVIAPIYLTVGDFSGGIAKVCLPNGLCGYVNTAGEYVWLPSR